MRVEKALGAVPGVTTVSINLGTEIATVVSEPAVETGQLQQAVEKAGQAQAASLTRHRFFLRLNIRYY